ncbi:MAG TPA: rubrerythrin family protein [Armatimonadota bacterium]
MTTSTLSLRGTRTEQNILTAFAGESQARNRYNFFASKAREEGFMQIADAFDETANQEKEHAKRLFKLLEGGLVKVEASFPAGAIGTTAENLRASAGGEHEEWNEMYPDFAKIAREEGFTAIGAIFTAIATAEKQHERRYLGFLANVEAGTVFQKETKTRWRCRNCGYVHEGASAAKTCPACNHPQAHFEILCENW